MRLFGKIAFAVCIAVVLFFLVLFFYLRSNGQRLMTERASVILHRPARVESVEWIFPASLKVTGLYVEGLLWADEARVSANWRFFRANSFHVSSVTLINPVLTLHRNAENQVIWAEDRLIQTASPAADGISKETQMLLSVQAVIDDLNIRNGRIQFPSHESSGAVEFSLQDVYARAQNVPLSGQSMDVNVDVRGIIQGDGVPFLGDYLKGSGWINWPERNMDATFRLVNPDGKVDVEVNMNAKHNDMIVRGHLKTRHAKPGDAAGQSTAENLLDTVERAGLAVDLDFSFPARMDRWELSNIDFSGNLIASDEGKTGAETMQDLQDIGQQFREIGERMYDKKSD